MAQHAICATPRSGSNRSYSNGPIDHTATVAHLSESALSDSRTAAKTLLTDGPSVIVCGCSKNTAKAATVRKPAKNRLRRTSSLVNGFKVGLHILPEAKDKTGGSSDSFQERC